ncbi:class I adenylate-forming enzyme family protein [Pinisolibacter sp.]|uniref:class I adenylate-forming enzyme family protein n=1 Tax=Pinisolibacter sp. TaxID=2172024 RepID=UPI002FDDB302
MIVAREDESRVHTASGVWGRVTLDQIVAKNAQSRPDHPALIDFADRATWTHGAPESLTWRELQTRVDALAAFFLAVGLQPDTVIVFEVPPTSDAVVGFLAASRAGLVVAPLPLGAREADAIDLCRATGAKAILTVTETEGETHGERLRSVAAELFQIRFVFAAGGDVPDGLIDLAMVFAEAEGLGTPAEVVRKGNPADHALTVEIAALPGEIEADPASEARRAPLPRSHNHWIATGLMTLLEARIDADSVLVSPFAPTGTAGIGAALVPWLVAGATLVTGLPRATDGLAEEAATRGATHVLAPLRFARRIAERLALHRNDAAILAIGEEEPGDRPMPMGRDTIDVTIVGAFGLIARRRTDPLLPRPLPLGVLGAPAESEFAPPLVEVRIKALAQRAAQMPPNRTLGGEVQLRGAMVPHFNWPTTAQERRHRSRDPEGWMATGLGARIVSAQPPTFEVGGRVDGAVRIGQTTIDLDALDLVYRGVGGVADAAALVVVDDLEGPGIAAAVVPKSGVRFDPAAWLAAVEETRIGLARLPRRVYTVPAIARGPSGRVLRGGMTQHLMARP